jgi:nucleoside-diphosphate-sugar epimerase
MEGAFEVILVTGATGFIGGYVTRELLLMGEEVVAVSRYAPRPETSYLLDRFPASQLRLMLQDEHELARTIRESMVDCVIHLDAQSSPVALEKDPLTAVDANFLATLRLLELTREFGIGRFIFASSIAVLPAVLYEPIDAGHPIVTGRRGPAGGFYGASKAAAEVFALAYGEAFDVVTKVVRPSAVYGFGMQYPITVRPVVEGLREGLPVTIPARGPLRDYTYVEDVARLFATLATTMAPSSNIHFAATGRPLQSAEDVAAAARLVFPDGTVTLVDADADPTGIESGYRGRLAVDETLTDLGLPPFADLATGIERYARELEAFRRER